MPAMCDDVREAGSGDLDAILRLYGQLHPGDERASGEALRRVHEAILLSPHFTVLVLDVDGASLATAYLNVVPNLTRMASPYAVIENVVVDERRRGRGYGKRIMAGALERAWGTGCYKAMLLSGSSRESTHGFYRACGFSGEEKIGYVAYRPLPPTPDHTSSDHTLFGS